MKSNTTIFFTYKRGCTIFLMRIEITPWSAQPTQKCLTIFFCVLSFKLAYMFMCLEWVPVNTWKTKLHKRITVNMLWFIQKQSLSNCIPYANHIFRPEHFINGYISVLLGKSCLLHLCEEYCSLISELTILQNKKEP